MKFVRFCLTSLFFVNGAPEELFISEIDTSENLNKAKIIALAKQCGVNADETQIKELYEVSIMRSFKKRFSGNVQNDFETAVNIYNNQVNFAHRTSNSVLLQQYSTPLPLAYIAGAYVAHNQPKTAKYFEPSAGNGLLTVALPTKRTTVNEIDRNRRTNLETYFDFKRVLNMDGSKSLMDFARYFDGIITNPPFGRWDTEKIGGYPIQRLEHIMAIRALDTLKNSRRAAIIIGGHTEWDEVNRVRNGENRYFLSYLYHFYNVDDVININGQMYAKQGTTFPIRLILINGRKAVSDGTAPLKTDFDKTVSNFYELFNRVAINLNLSHGRMWENTYYTHLEKFSPYSSKNAKKEQDNWLNISKKSQPSQKSQKSLTSLKSLKTLTEIEREMQLAIAEMEREMGLNGIKKSVPKYLTKPLSAYTVVENGTDLTDWRDGADEISDRIKQRKNFGLKIPDYYYVRLRKLLDKIEQNR